MAYDAEGRSYYNGDWVNNIKQGYGKRQYPSGNVYEGMWFANIRQGEGVMKWYDRSGNLSDLYSGLWENGEQV
jgi:antitoxin component YwqK of YwqJK toxin-antitoxin module